MQKLAFSGLALAWLACAACSARQGTPLPPAKSPAEQATYSGTPVVTPANRLSGTIVRVNEGGQFVVVNFPIGQLPTLEQKMSVYHNGLKTGDLVITGPQLDDNVVADLVTGTAQPGDEVR